MKRGDMAGQSIFDELMRAGFQQEKGSDYLEQCMSFDSHLDKKVPLRYRLIALGFIKHYTLDELNRKLLQNHCEMLYSRNVWEAGLIYAFLKRMSYEKWREVARETENVMRDDSLSSPWFQNNGITYQELEKYVSDNSETGMQMPYLMTRHRTRLLSEKLGQAAADGERFSEFLRQNLSEFSLCREKTRYYFCKYLYYFLRTKMRGFLKGMENGARVSGNPMHDDMNVFVGIATRRRQKCSVGEMEAFLRQARISCGAIYDGLNEFYFGYASVNWMEALLEYYGNVERLPEDDRRYLAEALRHYHKEFKHLSDREVIEREERILKEREESLDRNYSQVEKAKIYQRGRQGENTVRKYIRGELDIDRISLLFYLLYFGYSADLPEKDRISRERLSDILVECGYAALQADNEFDRFVIQYLKAGDPGEYLADTVSAYALDERNFFLYKFFRNSVNQNELIQKLIRESTDGKDRRTDNL